MSAKKPFPVKLVVVIVFAVGVAVFAIMRQTKASLIRHQNRATAHFNAGEYDQAIQVYEELLPRFSEGADKERVRKQIAQCWKIQGDNPALTFDKQLEFYRKAREYDKDCITSKVFLRALEKGD